MRLALLAAFALAWPVAAVAAPARVVSLDQCADQFVLALAPEAVVGVSHRADDPDAYLRAEARGRPQRRASLESVLAARPQVAVRYWGGSPQLVRALERRGVAVVTLDDAQDFAGVRVNVERAADALGRPERGRALLARMDADLAAADGAWRGRRALYLTPGAFTAGDGTLIGAVFHAAGLIPAAPPGFGAAPLERLVLTPPAAFVLGFFDTARYARWQIARHPALERARRGRTAASLPAKLLGCPAWFAAEAGRTLADAAPRR